MNIQPLTYENYKNRTLLPGSNFSFAAQDTVCIISANQAPKASLNVPICFTEVSDRLQLVTLQSLTPHTNLLVDSKGRWIGKYLPEAYRSYPFFVVPNEDSQFVLCIDADSDRLSQEGDLSGQPFFTSSGSPTSELNEIKTQFGQYLNELNATKLIVEQLRDNDLLQPWTARLSKGGTDYPVKGLLCVNETSLNSLSAEKLAEIRDSGALVVAYCQLLSMAHLNGIIELTKAKWAADEDEIMFDNENSDGYLNFENL